MCELENAESRGDPATLDQAFPACEQGPELALSCAPVDAGSHIFWSDVTSAEPNSTNDRPGRHSREAESAGCPPASHGAEPSTLAPFPRLRREVFLRSNNTLVL